MSDRAEISSINTNEPDFGSNFGQLNHEYIDS